VSPFEEISRRSRKKGFTTAYIRFPDKSVWALLLSSFADREGEEVRASIDLRGNERLLVIVDSEEAR
jgi:hypothetical protein